MFGILIWENTMKKIVSLIFVLAVGFFSVAADDKKDAKSDKDQIQGRWQVESAVRGGQEIDGVQGFGVFYEFAGDKFILELGGQKHEGTFKLDPTKKPKTIDITLKMDDQESKRLGIYELDGDTLKICRGEPDETRPTEFKSKEGTQNVLAVAKRQKKEDKK
jgi:uncharacterized protein (TIGR03067 family)